MMEAKFNPLKQAEALVFNSLRDYLYAEQSGDVEQASNVYAELSSNLSHLFELHLQTTDWEDGWLDGIPFHSIASGNDQQVSFAGLLVWGDFDDKAFYLEPFQCRFEMDASSERLLSYLLCFRSQLENRRHIEYTTSVVRASRRIAIPDAKDEIEEAEWRYVFRKRPEGNGNT